MINSPLREVLSLIILLLVGIGLFQNCSKSTLVRPLAPVILNVTGQTNWCLDGNLQGYTVDTFYLRNVNISPWQGQFLPDSDADGLPDSVEVEVGFDPTNPRSRSSVLDGLCFNLSGTNSCPTAVTGCSSSPAPLGISQCEIQTLGLDQIYQHPTMGLDTDEDGIIDYFEIVGGTDPTVADANADPDHDNILNHTEYERQSNPQYADADASSASLMQISSSQVTGTAASSCSGEMWQLAVAHVPYVQDTLNFPSTSSGVFQAHTAGQNVIVAVVKFKPNSGTTGNSIIYYQIFVIDPNSTKLPIDANSMQQAGEVLN